MPEKMITVNDLASRMGLKPHEMEVFWSFTNLPFGTAEVSESDAKDILDYWSMSKAANN